MEHIFIEDISHNVYEHPNYGMIYGTDEDIRNTIDKLDLMWKNIDETDPYYQPLHISSCEICNGYNLYDTKDHLMLRKQFNDSIKLLKIPDDDFNTFYSKCDKDLCPEWSKIDEYGEYCKGFWEMPENSWERKNAWILTRRKNILKLFELPYPTSLIYKTLGIGCNNSFESVRYSNFVCEWFYRKYEQLMTCDDEELHLCNRKCPEYGWIENIEELI